MILDAIEQAGGIYVVTADHGNAEDMVKRNKSGQPLLDKSGNIQILTSHTLQPVSSSALLNPSWPDMFVFHRCTALVKSYVICHCCRCLLQSVGLDWLLESGSGTTYPMVDLPTWLRL